MKEIIFELTLTLVACFSYVTKLIPEVLLTTIKFNPKHFLRLSTISRAFRIFTVFWSITTGFYPLLPIIYNRSYKSPDKIGLFFS